MGVIYTSIKERVQSTSAYIKTTVVTVKSNKI